MQEQWGKSTIDYCGWEFGFTPEDAYPSFIVRLNKSRSVYFKGGPSSNFCLSIDDPSVCSAEFSKGYGATEVKLTISGKKAGACWVSICAASDPNKSLSDIYVRVYPLKTYKVNLFVVKDGSGKWPNTTLSQAQNILKEISKQLKSMAAIRLLPHVTQGFEIEPNAATQPVTSGYHSGPIWDALIQGAKQFDSSSSNLNLYFLNKFGSLDVCYGGACDEQVIGLGKLGRHQCLVEDLPDADAFQCLIAHELMHSVGMTHNDPRGEEALMHSYSKYGEIVYPEDVVEVRGEP